MILDLILSFMLIPSAPHAATCPDWMSQVIETTKQKTMQIGKRKWVVTQNLANKRKNIFVIQSTSGTKVEIKIDGTIYDFDIIDVGVKGEELPAIILARKAEDGNTEIVIHAWNATEPMLPNEKSDLIITGQLDVIQVLSAAKEKLVIGLDKQSQKIHLIDLAKLQVGAAPLKKGFMALSVFFPQKIQVGKISYLMTFYDGVYYFSESKSGQKLGFFSHSDL